MTVTEKVSYLKGLFDGLSIDKDTNEGKLFSAIIDTLDEIAQSVSEIDEVATSLGDELDDVYGELEAIGEDIDTLYGIDDECCCGDDDCCDDDCCCDDDDCDCCADDMYQVKCPTCGEEIYIDEGVLDQGKIDCPACGEELEFDLSLLDEDDIDEDGEDE